MGPGPPVRASHMLGLTASCGRRVWKRGGIGLSQCLIPIPLLPLEVVGGGWVSRPLALQRSKIQNRWYLESSVPGAWSLEPGLRKDSCVAVSSSGTHN